MAPSRMAPLTARQLSSVENGGSPRVFQASPDHASPPSDNPRYRHIFTFLELPDSPEYIRLRAKIAQLDPPEQVATTIVTYEEQSRGRLAMVSASRSTRQLVEAYTHLRQHLLNYTRIPIIEFDEQAALLAATIQKSKLRLGTMDVRIAAIALSRNALLLSRNIRDFKRVPNLRVEDWTT
jgi:tRNA(fMet)-specific endonuclease VapC